MVIDQNADGRGKSGLRARLLRAWARDGHLSLKRRLQKGGRYILQSVRGPFLLRRCNHVGRQPRVAGRTRVENQGSIVVGDYLNINSSWIPVELITGKDGVIRIGDDVQINFGTVVAAGSSVSIGSGSMIGPHCIICDVDIPEELAGVPTTPPRPIEIGQRVWLAARVTVRPGVRIGDGAVIAAGSIVERDIPANAMASGIPARPLPRMSSTPGTASESRAGADHGATAVASTPASTQESHTPEARGVLIADFNIEAFVYELGVPDVSPPAKALVMSHKLMSRSLAATPSTDSSDFVFIWTRPEVAVPEFGRLMAGEPVTERQLLAEVDAFCVDVERCAGRYRYVLLAAWTQPAFLGSHPLIDTRPGARAHALATMNLRLMAAFGRRANVVVLDAARWQAAVGSSAHDARAWYLNQVAMSRAVLIEAARDVRAVLATLRGQQRKLLVLAAGVAFWQLDSNAGASGLDTPWGDFQVALRGLRLRGTLLAVLGAVEQSMSGRTTAARPDLIREEDYVARVGVVIDEVVSLRELVAGLRVGLDEVVYVDTREAVRKRVREALPGVYVPDWPSDRLLYATAVHHLRCFGVDSAVPNLLAAAQ